MDATESQRRINERAKVVADSEALLLLLDRLVEKFPKSMKYSGSYAALLKSFGASMYAKINCAVYSTGNLRRRREFVEEAIGDYETIKVEKRILFAKKGRNNTYYVSKEQASSFDELLAVIGRQLVGWKKRLDRDMT